MVKWDPDNPADVVIDRFRYIHGTSLGIGIAVAVLAVILAAAFRRAGRKATIPVGRGPAPR